MSFTVLTKIIDLNTGTPGIRFIEAAGKVVSEAYKTKTGLYLYHYISTGCNQPLCTVEPLELRPGFTSPENFYAHLKSRFYPIHKFFESL